MKRTPLKRTTGLKRTKKITAKKRSASEFRRIYGSRARVAYVKTLPCFSCWSFGEIQNAHVNSGGMGRKANAAEIIPLCSKCHALQHANGWEALGELREPEYRAHLASVVEGGWERRSGT